MSAQEGGPTEPYMNELGVNIKGNNIIFTGDVTILNLPASLQTATFCPNSKFSNAKLVIFDNEKCVNQDVAIGYRSQPDTLIIGSYDYITKVLTILSTGNFRCEPAK